jgi:hypothetical protein
MSDSKKKIPVLVTTELRGVFFGWVDPAKVDDEILEMERAQLCVYWSADVKGFMGLASKGPTAGCRIGAPAHIRLRKISSVLSCTPEAVAAWEAAPWSK